MTKKDLIESVASATGISIFDTTKTIEALITTIKKNVMAGKPIFLRGFGTFALKVRGARKGRDIRNDKVIDIPERKMPTFKVSKNFADEI